MDWNKAEIHLRKKKEKYEKKGGIYVSYLDKAINPLFQRYINGERTDALYQDIWKIN